MYCRKAKLKLPMKSILKEYKSGKARLLTMLEEPDDPVVKTVQPSLKTGRKWKVTEAVDEAKECLKMKEVIGQTQTDRRGLGSTTAKWWSKTEGKEKRDMIIDEIRNKEDSTRVKKAVQQSRQDRDREELETHLKKTYSDPTREIPLEETTGLVWPAAPGIKFDSKPPSLQEVIAVVNKARAKSAPGPNGVPYLPQ
ncbi:reverse transcriptase [Plakobranchus ocellatus]|uniref:Reverse transcriptase n=1 Tax=Plakobranchus ocellatus TaxID=259542 RepID=A0AAV4BPM0_9GAST|nr:reverse transcriptase [Plakobranchus ocellatus]